MPITLQRFINGDTSYVAKHNSNAGVVEAFVSSLETQILASSGAAVSAGSAFTALFGNLAAIVGEGGYVPTPTGTTLSVAPGFFWRPSTGTLVQTLVATSLPFAGVAAATYYLQVGIGGVVIRDTTSAESAYSVVWTGSAFGAITRTARIVFGAEDWVNAQTSAALGASYTSLDGRLEADEALIAGAAPLASPTFTGTPVAPTAAPGTNTTQLATTAFVVAAASPVVFQLACGDESTALTAGTGKVTFRAPYAFTLTGVRASVNTAPTGGTLLTVDINESGTTVLSTKLTFDASEKTTTTAVTAAVISDSAVADDAEISVDIDSVGSTIAGAGLKVTLIGTRP